MALNRVGEILYLDGDDDRMLELSVNQFAAATFTRAATSTSGGSRWGTSARWEYEVDGVAVVKELQLCGAERGRRAVHGRAGRGGGGSG